MDAMNAHRFQRRIAGIVFLVATGSFLIGSEILAGAAGSGAGLNQSRVSLCAGIELLNVAAVLGIGLLIGPALVSFSFTTGIG